MSEDFKFTQLIVFLFARCLFDEFFLRFSALQCLAKQRKMSATLGQFQYACPFENCHKSYNSKKHINAWTLSFYRHGSPCFNFEDNTSGRARLWDTALKFLAEAFSWRHQITWHRAYSTSGTQNKVIGAASQTLLIGVRLRLQRKLHLWGGVNRSTDRRIW